MAKSTGTAHGQAQAGEAAKDETLVEYRMSVSSATVAEVRA